jgi:hypothetical protein
MKQNGASGGHPQRPGGWTVGARSASWWQAANNPPGSRSGCGVPRASPRPRAGCESKLGSRTGSGIAAVPARGGWKQPGSSDGCGTRSGSVHAYHHRFCPRRSARRGCSARRKLMASRRGGSLRRMATELEVLHGTTPAEGWDCLLRSDSDRSSLGKCARTPWSAIIGSRSAFLMASTTASAVGLEPECPQRG